jgi:light-regulated signal transduction histidine kinase (bacteriophytochrome)
VWSNLIGNALKYSAKRAAPHIVVSGRVDGDETIYKVQDNGAGFDMTYADKLFGVFKRLHSADEYAGTGVGLAIVHRIITRHHGRVWAQGAPDAGACMQFALPNQSPVQDFADVQT